MSAEGKQNLIFVERIAPLRIWPFNRWKGGIYDFDLKNNNYNYELDFFHWVFENEMQKEIRYKKQNFNFGRRIYRIYFKTPEAFMAFKLYWC